MKYQGKEKEMMENQCNQKIKNFQHPLFITPLCQLLTILLRCNQISLQHRPATRDIQMHPKILS